MPRKKTKKTQTLENENSDFKIENPKKNAKLNENAESVIPTIRCGDFVVDRLIYNFGTRKKRQKTFIGQILRSQADRLNDQYEVSFLRKTRISNDENEAENYFIFPNITDTWLLLTDQIVEKINLLKTLRGKYYFDLTLMYTNIDDIE